MKDWLLFRITHSQKNYIDLFCRQVDQYVEIYITTFKKDQEIILFHDQLIGTVDELKLDQTLASIPWTKITRSFHNIHYVHAEFDNFINIKRTGHHENLDFIHNHIANAINFSHDNKGYAKHIKKNIIGTWEALDLTLIFKEDETFELIGEPKISTTLAGVVNKGILYNKRNFITFLEGEQMGGYNMPLYDLTNDYLILPGYSNFLLLKFKRD